MDVLEKIKRLQEERSWSGLRLAEMAGLSPSTISMMYMRNNQPSVPTLQAICEAFGITLSQFFSESNIPPGLTSEQKTLLKHWNRLTDDQKKAVLDLIKCI
jgi:transcriptional regulator with XRE-family HTH domain